MTTQSLSDSAMTNYSLHPLMYVNDTLCHTAVNRSYCLFIIQIIMTCAVAINALVKINSY